MNTTPQDFAAAREYASTVLSKVEPSTYDQQSACDEFTVRDAINHLIGGMHFFVGVATDSLPPEDAPRPDFTEGDPRAAFESVADDFERIYVGDVLTEDLGGPNGERTGQFFHGIATMECTLHGWDIAQGAGIDAQMPDVLVDTVRDIVATLNQGPSDAFDPPVEVADDASAQDKLVALSGRTP